MRREAWKLPINRRQLFVFTYRTHIGLLIRLSLLLALFSLPMFLVGLISEAMQGSLSAQWLTAEDLTAYRTFLVRGMFGASLNIPAGLILGIGLTGAFSLMKDYTFADGYLFLKSFFGGIRANRKDALVLTLLWTVTEFLIRFAHLYLSMYAVSLYTPMLIVTLVLRLILLCAYLFALAQLPVYRASAMRTCKNGFLFTFSRLLPTMGLACLTFAPVVATDLLGGAVRVIVFCLYAAILWGNAVLSITLWCQHCFDETVNRTQFPEIYRRGLYDEGAQGNLACSPIYPEAMPPERESAGHTLCVQNLTMSYDGETDVFSDISFSCGEGFFCICGASGCGKTSLLRTISGLELADGGTVLLDGQDITDEETHRRRMAFIFQDGGLYPHLTLYQNVYMACRDDARAKAYLKAFGLMAHCNRKPKHLSGGERQKLAMAKCMATDARLYLMDEPLSAVDPRSREQILSLLRTWQEKKHATVLYVSHDLQQVQQLDAQCYFLSNTQ